MKKVLLVTKGRLADLVALSWLKEKKNMSIYTYTSQIGKGSVPPDKIGEDAIKLGVESAYLGELTDDFYKYVLTHAIRGGLRGENGSFLTNALTRPVLVKEMAKIARENGCGYVAFSESPYSLDQLRFLTLFNSIDQSLEVISPQVEWPMQTYRDMLKYAREHNLPFDDKHRKEFSIEKNIWGVRIKCGRIDNLWKDTPEDLYTETRKIEQSENKPRYIEIDFKKGLPVKLNGEEIGGIDIIKQLNKLGIKHGLGRMDIIERELLGIKARIVQECPAAQIIYTAHKGLEDITLPQNTLEIQKTLANHLTRMAYEGKWFNNLRKAICEFFKSTQENVTGRIRLKLYKGNCVVMRRKADKPLYSRELVTGEERGVFPVEDIKNFLNVWKTSRAPKYSAFSDRLD